MKKTATQGGSGQSSNTVPILPAFIDELQRLQPLETELALLPVGWGNKQKGPMLEGWQHHGGFTVAELQQQRCMRSVGVRTGFKGPLLCFDFDGESALELACSLDMEPWAVSTWQVHRDTDPFRFKVLFKPTPDQIAQLPDGAEFQGKTITKQAVLDADGTPIEMGEALEVFFHGGRQVIVLGEHPSSGGFYFWPPEPSLGPEALSPPPDAWLDHAIDIAKQCHDRPKLSNKSSSTSTGIRRLDPCPICGRNSRGGNSLWCGQAIDGLIFCMPGSTFNADPYGSMSLGTVVSGFALMKRTPIPEGDCLIFGPDMPINPSRRIRRPQRTFRSRVDVKD